MGFLTAKPAIPTVPTPPTNEDKDVQKAQAEAKAQRLAAHSFRRTILTDLTKLDEQPLRKTTLGS